MKDPQPPKFERESDEAAASKGLRVGGARRSFENYRLKATVFEAVLAASGLRIPVHGIR